MPRQNDDLFEATKMTFGQHLDELRGSLIKAIAALVIGTLVGLLFAQRLVDYVQTPLRDALVDYYRDYEAERYKEWLLDEHKNGAELPDDLDAAAKLYAERGLVAERRKVDPHELAKALGIELEPDPAGQLIPITFYRELENDPRISTVALGMQEPFMVWMKAAFVLGVVLASPFVFYFIWSFVGAGLYPHEKRYIHIFLPFSIGLFLLGAGLAFFVVFKFVLSFLLGFYGWMGINPTPRITEWLNFVLVLPIGFGIGFQLPLVMLFLERIGVMSVKLYQEKWRIAILAISVLSMLLTPADYQSMLFMFGSLTVLYLGGILLCKFMPRKKSAFGA